MYIYDLTKEAYAAIIECCLLIEKDGKSLTDKFFMTHPCNVINVVSSQGICPHFSTISWTHR